MNYRFSFFIAITTASLMFLLSVTARAESLSFSVTQPSVDLRAFDSPVETQFGQSSSAFAVASAMDNVLKAQGSTKTVSKKDLWSNYGVDDLDLAVHAASQYSIAEGSYWPTEGARDPAYRDHRTLRLSESVGLEGNVDAALRALEQGHPVVLSIAGAPQDLTDCQASINANSPKTDATQVVEVVGYHIDAQASGGGTFILKNSHGTACGDQGYQTYPFSLCADGSCSFVEVIGVEHP